MRQHVRKAILLCSFLLFPITLFYFSPALIIMGAAQGIVVASLMVFALQFLSALILGRAFCAWLCPAAGLQEACFPIRDRRVKVGKADWIKWGIWIPWMTVLVVVTVKAGGFHSVQPLFMFENGVSVSEPAQYVIYYKDKGSCIAGRNAYDRGV